MLLTNSSFAVVTMEGDSRASGAYQLQHSDHSDLTTAVARDAGIDKTNTLPVDATHNLHYFDVLHPILLSHVRRANSSGVLTLLSLPSIVENEVFWCTCTYREGLVAALLIHVMEQTGQMTVPASSPTWLRSTDVATSSRGSLETSNKHAFDCRARSPGATPDANQDSSFSSPSQPFSVEPSPPSDSAPVTSHRVLTSPPLSFTPLTADDLHILLHLCIYEEADAPISHARIRNGFSSLQNTSPDATETASARDRRQPAALASLLRVGTALRDQRCRSNTSADGKGAPVTRCWSTAASWEEARGMGVAYYIQGVMRRLEAIMAEEVRGEGSSPGASSLPTRKRPRPGREPTTASVCSGVGGIRNSTNKSSVADLHSTAPEGVTATAHADSISLAALSAVLQEHCHVMSYVNPLRDDYAASAAVEESRESTTTTATTTMGISSSNSNDSLTNIRQVTATTTTTTTHPSSTEVAEVRTSLEGPVDTALLVVPIEGEGARLNAAEDTTAEDVSNGLDAVELLRRIPAISAARWALPSSAADSRVCDTVSTSPGLPCSFPTEGGKADAQPEGGDQQHRRGAPTSDYPGSSFFGTKGASSASTTPDQPPPPPPQQHSDEAQTRLSESIRVFDAFTTALQQSALATAHVSAGSVVPSLALDAMPSLTTGGIAEGCAAAKLTISGARHARNAAPAASPKPGVRRRHKFSPQEDAAILHGVARFGPMSGSFQYILHAYRGVWRAGRTALHLYDHWRGALRRRAVTASIDGAASDAEWVSREQEPADEDEANTVSRVSHAALSNEQELSSEIEDSSDE